MTDLRDPTLTAETVAAALELTPHPEGGRYREMWRDEPGEGGRGAATSILFLLARGERSHWHRVDAAELWLWQAGAPLRLDVGGVETQLLGPSVGAGEMLQAIVPANAWQAAETSGDWTLVGCVVAPAFRFEGFELAPETWSPPC